MPIAFLSLPSQSFLCECFLYEPDTGLLIWRERPKYHFSSDVRFRNFNRNQAGKQAGLVHQGYRKVSINRTTMLTSRVIWKLMTGEDPPALVDHMNGNSIDDRWANLRAATHRENCVNRRGANKNNQANMKGVRQIASGRCMARIMADGRLYYLGLYDTPELAHAAYVAAARRLHGAFAREA